MKLEEALSRSVVPLWRFLRRHSRKTTIALFAVFLWAVFFSPWHMSRIRHQSVRYQFVLWRDLPADHVFRLGEYVLARWQGADPNKVGLTDGMLLVKRIGCLPGGKVVVNEEREVECDGVYLGMSRQYVTESGTAVSPWTFKAPYEEVPEGHVFLIGDSTQSYDSRFWGFFPIRRILGFVLSGF